MKKLLILILLFSLTGCSSQVDLGAKKEKKEKPVKVEKLKASKDKILKVQNVDECVEWKDEEKLECKKTKKVKQYHYISDKKVGKQKINYKGVELEEDLSKRTKNSIHFKIPKDDSLLGAGEVVGDEYVAKFYSGDPFFEYDNSWYQTEVATTTIDNYNDNQIATSTVLINFINWLGGYEVLADVTSFYTSAGDGRTRYFNSSSWDTSHDATASSDAIYTQNLIEIESGYIAGGTKKYLIGRGFFPFDTSGLTSSATVSSASFYGYVLYFADNSGSAYAYLSIVQTTQASTASLVVADYDNCGAVNSPTKGSGDITIASLTASAYKEIPLNATGLGWISKTGYTKLGIREGHDIEDVSIGTSGARDYFAFASLEATGTATDPYLYITYTLGGTSRRTMLIN